MNKKIYEAPNMEVMEVCVVKMLCVSGQIGGNLDDLGDTDMDPASDFLKSPAIWEGE
ncbi:MAG: hypothetical protein K2N13_00010 [Paraprevotella sp.]|nr:hypothetical protein [Paraprevotella sp.]